MKIGFARFARRDGCTATDAATSPGREEVWKGNPTMCYDIGRRTIQDMVWQGSKEQDEVGAFCELVDRASPAYAPDGTRLEPLWLGERNFYSHNSLCHLREAGHSFIVRMQDDHVERLLEKGDVREGCFDVTVERVFARTSSARARTRPDEPEKYRCLERRTRFDAIGLDDRASEYLMALRVVRRRLPGTGTRASGATSPRAEPSCHAIRSTPTSQKLRELYVIQDLPALTMALRASSSWRARWTHPSPESPRSAPSSPPAGMPTDERTGFSCCPSPHMSRTLSTA